MDPLINVGDVTDLVILDIELPRLGGRDVQRELAANAATRNIPIVVVTGSDTSLLDACAFYCVLRKPVTTDSLVAIVDRCLQDAQRRRNRPAASRAQAERRKARTAPSVAIMRFDAKQQRRRASQYICSPAPKPFVLARPAGVVDSLRLGQMTATAAIRDGFLVL
jgi:DNA-binding response OmpR family regulator